MTNKLADKTYSILCISMYKADESNLKQKVAKLKELGWSGANRSALIRLAIDMLDDKALAKLAHQKVGTR
jgi:hypothetical protein